MLFILTCWAGMSLPQEEHGRIAQFMQQYYEIVVE
jgi:hypothetical protein